MPLTPEKRLEIIKSAYRRYGKMKAEGKPLVSRKPALPPPPSPPRSPELSVVKDRKA